jgi:uncharacterized SAM-binding protein YcdF (DUF218 family)
MIKIILCILGGIVGAFLLSIVIYLPFVISDALKKNRDKCEYLLILGGNIIGADTPSPQLKERMKAAAVYLNENPETVAVPCGGCFRDGQKKSEAAIIADYLVGQGIDADRIVLEDKSTTTYENFEFGTRIIENHAGKTLDDISIAFLSSDYHLHRAAIIAKRCGVKNCGRVSSPTPGKALPRYARECIVAVELLYRSLWKK